MINSVVARISLGVAGPATAEPERVLNRKLTAAKWTSFIAKDEDLVSSSRSVNKMVNSLHEKVPLTSRNVGGLLHRETLPSI